MPDPPAPGRKPPQSNESVVLVRQAQNGNLDALNQLFQRYYTRVQRIVRLRLGQELRQSLDSGDILQDTFIGAIEGLRDFEMQDDSSLIHWLSKIAEHRIKAAAEYHGAKKRSKRREVALRHVLDSQASGSLVLEPPAEERPAIEEMVQEENRDLVEGCLAEIRESYREVILLRDYVGASWDTIARLLNSKSANAARMLYARAVTALTCAVRRRQQP